MMQNCNESAKTNKTCEWCGEPIEQKSGQGRERKYCTPHHGKLARRNANSMLG